MASPQPTKKSGGAGSVKIPMRLIEDEKKRRVTLSKRRNGVFKKATELSTLCGAQVAVVVFSPSGKAHSFGHPSVELVADQFFNGNPQRDPTSFVNHGMELQNLKEQCDEIQDKIKEEKKRARELEEALQNSPVQLSIESLNQMDLTELQQVKEKMEELQKKLREKVDGSGLNPMEKMDSEDSGLEKMEEDGVVGDGDASPIPTDWLKL